MDRTNASTGERPAGDCSNYIRLCKCLGRLPPARAHAPQARYFALITRGETTVWRRRVAPPQCRWLFRKGYSQYQ